VVAVCFALPLGLGNIALVAVVGDAMLLRNTLSLLEEEV
jgi:hypothetical protein